jgi:hypothetical protein
MWWSHGRENNCLFRTAQKMARGEGHESLSGGDKFTENYAIFTSKRLPSALATLPKVDSLMSSVPPESILRIPALDAKQPRS